MVRSSGRQEHREQVAARRAPTLVLAPSDPLFGPELALCAGLGRYEYCRRAPRCSLQALLPPAAPLEPPARRHRRRRRDEDGTMPLFRLFIISATDSA